jgi:hypothetical protein
VTGDRFLRLRVDDAKLSAAFVRGRSGTFADFSGYEGEVDTDAAAEHDLWGIASRSE